MAWRKREKTLNNVKFVIFSHVELLELIYPTSLDCTGVNGELYTIFDQYSSVMNDTNLLTMNFFKNMGTILANVVQLDECFEIWDGTCAGRHLGLSTFSMLDPSIESKWNALENDVLF